MQSISVSKTVKDLSIIGLATLLLTLLVWLPHLLSLNNFFGLNFSQGFATIYRNFDGIEYIIIAKSFYDPEIIKTLPQSLEAGYYPAHFPGFALAILAFAPVLGFLKSMLVVSLLSTIASAMAFYFLVRDFNLTKQPLFLSLVFLVLPARWLIVHSVGSSEPLFIFLVITALYFFLKFESNMKFKFLLLAGVFGFLAQLTRPPGILLFGALGLYVLWQYFFKSANKLTIFRYWPLGFIPLAIILVFGWYGIVLNDFWAYFHTGDNIHLTFPPYQVFNINQYWVGDIWLEDLIYIFGLGFLGGIMLLKGKTRPLGFFVLTYLVASSMVVHRDIARYSLPIFPFLLIAFEKVLVSREFKIVLGIIFLAIYLYSQNYIIQNIAPFPNIEAFN